jgi:DNA-directed RNA polymerase subunit RPC12/RpoP
MTTGSQDALRCPRCGARLDLVGEEFYPDQAESRVVWTYRCRRCGAEVHYSATCWAAR